MHPYLDVMYAPTYMYVRSLAHIFVLSNEEASCRWVLQYIHMYAL